MNAGIDKFLDHVDEWKFKLHARLSRMTAAQRKDPRNKFVANNLQLLEDSYRKGKAIE